MIQRIQTVYLIIVFGVILAMFFAPFGNFIGGTEEFVIKAWGIKNITIGETAVPTPQMGILMVLCCAIPFVTIFLYRWRWVQIRLCIVEIVLLIGLQIFVAYYIIRSGNIISEAAIHSMRYSLTDIMPLVCILLTYLAFRGILKDETIVKSLDRII